jgi:hypothetical protein
MLLAARCCCRSTPDRATILGDRRPAAGLFLPGGNRHLADLQPRLNGAQKIGGAKAGILSCAEPLSSALLSLLLLGITFTLPDWLGTLLILSSVVLRHDLAAAGKNGLTIIGQAHGGDLSLPHLQVDIRQLPAPARALSLVRHYATHLAAI